ncbi:MAG: hypothetical protein Q7S37_00965 [bacterium]|nr:hypothetical protein [bacterium]
MEPRNETEAKQEDLDKIPQSTTNVTPKHNNLLILLLVLLFIILAVVGALFYSQLPSDKKIFRNDTSPSSQTSTTTSVTGDKLSKPVTSDIGSEVKILDSEMSSQNTTDFSPNALSDTNLGL